MSARPGGWVNGVGWVAWLFDVENGARCQSSRGKPEANDYEWQHSDINEFSIHDQPVIVTRWADGTVPAAPGVTDPPSDGLGLPNARAVIEWWLADEHGSLAGVIEDEMYEAEPTAACVLDALRGLVKRQEFEDD